MFLISLFQTYLAIEYTLATKRFEEPLFHLFLIWYILFLSLQFSGLVFYDTIF